MYDSELFKNYLKLIYNSTYIPMHYYEHGEFAAKFPSWAIDLPSLTSGADLISSIGSGRPYEYVITHDYLYLGIVRNTASGGCVIAGPVSLAPLSLENLDKIILSLSTDESSYQEIAEYFDRTPSFSLSRFLNIMAMIHAGLNGEILDVDSFYHTEVSDLRTEVERTHSDVLMERKENENFHNTYFFEQEYFSYVEKGDIDGLTEFTKVIPDYKEGSMAKDNIRQSKNIFITTISLATRHAIAGGLDIETAYQLSDSYIQEMENMSDSAAITMLLNAAVFDFTHRVSDAKIPTDMSEEIFRCIQYISNHVNRNVSVEHLAGLLHMDRSTLSKKFKRELGFNISTFIMRRKLEEAKTLLLYTDKTVSEISEYLCFSSQAYFQNVFKKKYSMTPREFRMHHLQAQPSAASFGCRAK